MEEESVDFESSQSLSGSEQAFEESIKIDIPDWETNYFALRCESEQRVFDLVRMTHQAVRKNKAYKA